MLKKTYKKFEKQELKRLRNNLNRNSETKGIIIKIIDEKKFKKYLIKEIKLVFWIIILGGLGLFFIILCAFFDYFVRRI